MRMEESASFFNQLTDALTAAGVFTQLLEIGRETGVECGVAYGLIAPEIISHVTGKPANLDYCEIYGQPRFDGEEAPLPEEVEKLRKALRKQSLLP